MSSCVNMCGIYTCTLCSCVGEYQGSGLCGSRAVGTCVERRADGNAIREHPGSGCGHETPALHEVYSGLAHLVGALVMRHLPSMR